ncbi:nitrate/TMAO reductase, membrane-bound tetraheme cytochrome c subunit [Desulfitobacterium dichloroeliminans LMG P-21439]|uniref:Nitrate/TMAO reductase, membrane-bound tetraheme cytochrome c subunit n=1 Tax=Desulfitobacterium dichloroeliminans (strain LMG P-21439 / DCA1) TaxID=871963 RepID=L0F8Q3_DESDL|nr:NapC/NirT family cytochrome c [Desulfitobacterium dichloroeliminans]AGA69011.1 nitrate/TMAO reductase, membrane-bound tetraheme cytochrome c subunit [Desulfitobacterium dichloroeliminans LMG P-21439]
MKKLVLIVAILSLSFGLLLLTKHPALGLDGPVFCGSCHVMEEQVETYLHSAHRLGTKCGDCHVPHSLVPGAINKAYTGTKDFIGVLRDKDPYTIEVSPLGQDIIQENCLRCHGDLLHMVGDTKRDGGRFCFDCHRDTPHLN